MAEDPQKKRLGRGLAALLGDVEPERVSEEDTRGLRRVPIDLIARNPRNPRKSFDEADRIEQLLSDPKVFRDLFD